MSPVLVPAFPEVLRAGLPCVVILRELDEHEPGYTGNGPIYVACSWRGVVTGLYGLPCEEPWAHVSLTDEDMPTAAEPLVEHLRIDLRDPSVRDAVVRAIWRALRPTEPEPLTVPCFFALMPDGAFYRWTLEHPEGGASTDFGATEHPDPRFGGHVMAIPALAAIPLDSPDRDLLALAAVAKAVLS